MNTTSLKDRSALITGAGSGIGRAIALRLAAGGADLHLVGRTPAKLETICTEIAPTRGSIHIVPCDLDKDDDVTALGSHLERLGDRLDFLIHAAGVIAMGALETIPIAEMDRQYRINVRAPLLLTQILLPRLRAARGQIVFINSSAGVCVKEQAGAYAATKHALKAIADTLRMEVNASGVRVLSVFPGNTATPMQEQVCRELGRPYDPQPLLQPDDVAAAVVNALLLPASAELTDLHIRPAQK